MGKKKSVFDNLKWKKIEVEGFEDLATFEEFDDPTNYPVIEEGFSKTTIDDDDSKKINEENKKKSNKKSSKTNKKKRKREEQPEINVSMDEWKKFKLLDSIIKNLALQGFSKPTPIQSAVLKDACHKNCDIIAAAETGSGKTLAFAIPIVQKLLVQKNEKKMKALILTPTRELALQVTKHIESIIKNTQIKVKIKFFQINKKQIASIVGGISIEKQHRLLSYRPDIVVGTIGRYWDLTKNVKKKRKKN